MSRISKILTRVRDSLSDPNGDRWSDARLLRLLDDAQRDIAIKAKLIRKSRTIPLVAGQAVYDLHSEVYLLQRVLYDTEALAIHTRDWMDKHIDKAWELEEGLPESVVYDKTNLGQMQIYPIPDDTVGASAYEFLPSLILSAEPEVPETWVPIRTTTYLFQPSLSRAYNGAEFSSDFGVFADSGGDGDTFNSIYGVITGLSYTEAELADGGIVCAGETLTLNSDYGVLTELGDSEYTYYSRSDGDFGVLATISDAIAHSDFGIMAKTDSALDEFSSDYGVIATATDTEVEPAGGDYIYYSRDSIDYGILATMSDGAFSSVYGIVTDIRWPESSQFIAGNGSETQLGIYGVTTAIDEEAEWLKYHYLVNPDEITAVTDTLAIDSVFDVALKYYVTAMALRDDMDTQNRTLAQEYLTLYGRELEEATRASERDFTQSTQYAVDYRSLV